MATTRRRTTRRRTTTTRRRPTRRTTARRRTRRKKTVKFNLSKHVSREISGIFFIGFAVLNFLALQSDAGELGTVWTENLLVPIFGLGALVVPLCSLIIGLTLLFSTKVKFAFDRVLGISLLLASTLGLVQLSAPIGTLFESSPEFGGYIGFVAHFILYSLLGQTGTAITLVGIALVSLLLLFKISFGELFGFLGDWFTTTEEEDVPVPLKSSKQTATPIKSTKKTTADEFELNIVRGQDSEKEKTIPNAQKAAPDKTKEVKTDTKPIPEESKKSQGIKKVDFSDYKIPPLELLETDPKQQSHGDDHLVQNAEIIRRKLEQFNIRVTMKDAHVGPRVVQYTLKPAEDVKLSKITALKNDLALALSARAIRIEAPIPGKGLVGIEVPAPESTFVNLGSLLRLTSFQERKTELKFALGRDVSGHPVISELSTMPHLLVAGQTGAGKSIGINTFLISLLYQYSPEDLRFILVDPKRVELTNYNGIPHLLTPVITEPEKALQALKWTVSEMNRRYKEFAKHGKRNLTEYNTAFPENKMPFIIVIVDELADLMMAASKEIEATICRLAQMARATGVHLVIATQRPSVDVITGLIKANIPTRIAYTVATGTDSRTIIDSVGAEDLLGTGDLLYLASDMAKPMRLQGSFVSTKEISKVINFIKLNSPQGIEYDDTVTQDHSDVRVPGIKTRGGAGQSTGSGNSDIERAIEAIREGRKASASFLQRRCSFGYAKAARILDQLEEMGLVGPSNGAKPRAIYVTNDAEEPAGSVADGGE